LLTRLAKWQSQQVLFHQRLVNGCNRADFSLYFIKRDVFSRTGQQQSPHQVLQLPNVLGPGIIAQSVLRRDTESTERQSFGIDPFVDVVSQ